jgi:hypothetical protein
MRFASTYVCIEGKSIMQEGGYRTFPISPAAMNRRPAKCMAAAPR